MTIYVKQTKRSRALQAWLDGGGNATTLAMLVAHSEAWVFRLARGEIEFTDDLQALIGPLASIDERADEVLAPVLVPAEPDLA